MRRKYHIAGFAVVGPSALVSATAIAGHPYFHPQFHTQDRFGSEGLQTSGCEVSSDGYACLGLVTEGTFFADTPFQDVRVVEYGLAGTVYMLRVLQCLVSRDTIDVGPNARTAKFEALIDIARDGCESYGYTVDYSTGEYGPPDEFPNSVSIRALLSDPLSTDSSNSTGHTSTKEGARYNYTCKRDYANMYEDASVECNGSPKVTQFADGYSGHCTSVSKP